MVQAQVQVEEVIGGGGGGQGPDIEDDGIRLSLLFSVSFFLLFSCLRTRMYRSP